MKSVADVTRGHDPGSCIIEGREKNAKLPLVDRVRDLGKDTHTLQSPASVRENCGPVSWGTGSYLCSCRLHTRIWPCHERVLHGLYLSGVTG